MRRLNLAAAVVLVLLLPLAAAAAGGKAPAAAKSPAAPAAPPNITAAMAKAGCKAFAALVAASPDALATFQSSADGGVTVFCPTDDAVNSFKPKYKNLTADGKTSLLLFHAVPVYFSLRSLKSNNGVMNTLATDGSSKNYNFTVLNEGDEVTIKTDASDAAARVKSTVFDKDPIAVYALDAVLEPVELFKPAPSPAPAPAPVADAPKASKRAHHHVADAPGPAADDTAPADQKKQSKKSAAAGAPCVRWLAAVSVAAATALA